MEMGWKRKHTRALRRQARESGRRADGLLSELADARAAAAASAERAKALEAAQKAVREELRQVNRAKRHLQAISPPLKNRGQPGSCLSQTLDPHPS